MRTRFYSVASTLIIGAVFAYTIFVAKQPIENGNAVLVTIDQLAFSPLSNASPMTMCRGTKIEVPQCNVDSFRHLIGKFVSDA